jgi:uncharacterized membrane protein
MSLLINSIVAISNLSYLYFTKDNNNKYCYYGYLPMIVSIIYHLAETKHKLIGLYPINLYANYLLNIDRIFAILSLLWCLYFYYLYRQIIKNKVIIIAIVGIISLVYSERDIIYENIIHQVPNNKSYFFVNYYDFLVFHTCWHIIAFYCLAYTFTSF